MKSLVRWVLAAGALSELSFAAPSLTTSTLKLELQQADWTTQEWDVIVVGAGTAGIVVADRLAEAKKKTLLLEIGGPSYYVTGGRERPAWLEGNPLSRVDVPGLYKSIFSGNPELLCPPGVVRSFQACAVGGNSAINAGLFFQPPDSDWDDFHPTGWKSVDMKNATKKLLSKQKSVEVYSQDGKFYLQSGYNAAKAWIVGKAGYSNVTFNKVPNQKTKVFGRPSYNYVNGQRGGPTVAHLQDALKLSNFHLATKARVLRIVHTKGQATGVLVTVDNKNVTIPLAPKGRVIVSAGAIASPGLLMRSGVGPQTTLSQLHDAGASPYTSSNWVVNSAVGQGLFDNPNTFLVLSGPTIKSYVHSYDNPIAADKALYLNSRSGPYAVASQTSAFWSYIVNDDKTRTGVQGTIDSSGFMSAANNTITLNVYGTSGLLSTGFVGFTNDGKFTPQPQGNIYYGHPRDGMNIAKFIHDIFQKLPPSTPQKPAASGLTPLNLAQNSTVDEIYRYITSSTAYTRGSVQHWSSSCRIGSCVDSNTKVVGTANIHVVDASIVAPLTVNPQFGVMVAAEKAAERILAVWK